MSLGWVAFGVLVCLAAVVALLPGFDSTDDSNWG